MLSTSFHNPGLQKCSPFFVDVIMAKVKYILIAAAVVSFAILCGLVKYSHGRISRLEREIGSRSAEIERLNGIISEFSDYMKRQNAATIEHAERIDNAASEITEKIHEIENDGGACNWLDEPLPLCLQEQFNTAAGINSGRDETANGSIKDM